MGKKSKRTFVFEEEFKELGKLAPRIKALLSMNREIAEGYRKHRKKGGEAIPALEKHLGVMKPECVPALNPSPETSTAGTGVADECAGTNNSKKQETKIPSNEVTLSAKKPAKRNRRKPTSTEPELIV